MQYDIRWNVGQILAHSCALTPPSSLASLASLAFSFPGPLLHFLSESTIFLFQGVIGASTGLELQ